MRAEQRERWTSAVGAAVVLAALALPAGCADGVFTAGEPGSVAAVDAVHALPPPADARLYTPEVVATLPRELVGSWSGDDAQGVGSWTVEFASDGRFAEYNLRRGITVLGQAAVAGRRLYLQPNDADSQTLTWKVSGSRLSLDGTVYSRTHAVVRDGTAPAGSRTG